MVNAGLAIMAPALLDYPDRKGTQNSLIMAKESIK